MDLNEPRDHKPDGDARAPDSHAHDDAGKTPKKRRKVNHGMLAAAGRPRFLSAPSPRSTRGPQADAPVLALPQPVCTAADL